jgi:transglutaminase-like putative cysteine protease
MRRNAHVHMELEVDASAELVLSVAIARAGGGDVPTVLQSGRQVSVVELLDLHGTRLHRAQVGPGEVVVDYEVQLDGLLDVAERLPVDEIRYLRPSRYCESDSLGPIARAEFAGLTGNELLVGVSSWVGQHLAYVPGSSLPTDGAVRTLISRQGVCRDFAHLVVALLRALDVPARLVSVYAPGLQPMDFHAVAEAFIDGAWNVVDATTLAPRGSLMRIATGRDAADTAFLSSSGGAVTLLALEVGAVVDVLPDDDLNARVSLR